MTETAIASVVEPSKELELNYTPLVITSNLDGLRAYVENITEPFINGDIDISTPELEKEARAILSELNKEIKAIDERRKTGIAEISAPIKEIENELKEIVKTGNDAYRQCKDALDAKVAADSKARRDALEIEYIGIVGEDVARSVPYDKMANPKWHTKTHGEIKSQNELFEKAEKIVSDIKVLNNQTLAHPEKVMARFLDTLDLSNALAFDAELTEQEQAEKERAEEAAKAFKLQQKETKPEPKPEPIVTQSEDVELSDYTITIKGISIFDAKEIARYIADKTGVRPELKKVK